MSDGLGIDMEMIYGPECETCGTMAGMTVSAVVGKEIVQVTLACPDCGRTLEADLARGDFAAWRSFTLVLKEADDEQDKTQHSISQPDV